MAADDAAVRRRGRLNFYRRCRTRSGQDAKAGAVRGSVTGSTRSRTSPPMTPSLKAEEAARVRVIAPNRMAGRTALPKVVEWARYGVEKARQPTPAPAPSAADRRAAPRSSPTCARPTPEDHRRHGAGENDIPPTHCSSAFTTTGAPCRPRLAAQPGRRSSRPTWTRRAR